MGVDRDGFDAAMAAQRERSRGAQTAGYRSDPALAGLASEFIGYPNQTVAEGLAVLAVRAATDDGPAAVVLAQTPFYAEGGGQIGDRGRLVGRRGSLDVTDTQRDGDAIVHLGVLDGELAAGRDSPGRGRPGAALGGGAEPHRHSPASPRAAHGPGRAGQAGGELGGA